MEQTKPKKKGYDFSEVEPRIMQFWEDEKVFKFDMNKDNIYSIDTPPPNISGKMHIGHAFGYSQQDFIARFMRMRGKSVFYPFGTDDNGLPTERLIEKTKNIKSIDMTRAEFVKICLNFLKDYTPKAVQDWKDLGVSCDYDITYSTIDLQAQKVSQESFVELWNRGHIYKKSFPTIWCPHCQTSIAQAELEDKESSTKFSTLKFSCEDKDLLIATTRPEMLPACVAVFVNPKDERYTSIIGKRAKVPLFNFKVPIIADDSAQIDKGTGVLMICCYGDRFDVDAVNRHGLEPKVIMGKDGRINAQGYEGLYVTKARAEILKDLKEANLIAEQKEMTHAVNVHDKCGTAIEFVDTPQWFIRVLDKKEKLIEQGNKVKWYPDHMKKRYNNWVNGLEWDWSISRNRHFGVPIPAWECEECEEIIIPGKSELPIDPLAIEKRCPKCGKAAKPESMVLDTWATSSVTPQIATDLIGGKIKIPFNLRPQGHDIIRTWAFYTIVKSYLQENSIPWRDIIISGNVSMGGEKMSKSKGNVIDPRKVIENYGADALRFWAGGSKLGGDLDYQEQDLVAGKKTVTKLWNASKFVFINLEGYDGETPEKLEKIDEEFLKHLDSLVKSVTAHFENYHYSHAKDNVERFFWSDLADNYIEIVKKRVYQGSGNKKLSAQYTLYKSLLTILKLFAPFMPFITEEIYQIYFKKTEKDKSIHLSAWPKFDKKAKKSEAFDKFVEVLGRVRQAKTVAQKSMNSEIATTLSAEDISAIEGMKEDFKAVTNSAEIKQGEFDVEFTEKQA